jgi:hypothetical protein
MRQGTKSSGGMITTGVKPQPVSRVKTTVSPKRVFAGTSFNCYYSFNQDLCFQHFLLLGARGTVKPLSPAKQRQRFTSSDGYDNVTM